MTPEPKRVEAVRFLRINRTGQGAVDYLHVWPTGHQELVFRSHEAAKKWAADKGAEYAR